MTPRPILIRTLIVLGLTQVIGWGTMGLVAIVGRQMADDLGMNIASIFTSYSILYVMIGLCSPLLGQVFVSVGARRVMICGTPIAILGFAVLATARGPVAYFIAWMILGVSGSSTLTTPANILLNEIAGRKARRAIGALMLLTGLSSSVFWPITSFLSHVVHWRTICMIYASVLALLSLPLLMFGLPRRAPWPAGPDAAACEVMPGTKLVGIFWLVVAAIGPNVFVTFGFGAVMIELLRAEGLPSALAVTFGASLGVIQVCARAIDFVGGGRWDGITTGIFAGGAMLLGMVVLIIGGGAYWSVVAFILLYGLGSGALAVARATIPLVVYGKAGFAKGAAHIALPLNVISALAPPGLSALLTRLGSNAVLGLAILCSACAVIIMVVLDRHRPEDQAT